MHILARFHQRSNYKKVNTGKLKRCYISPIIPEATTEPISFTKVDMEAYLLDVIILILKLVQHF